MTLFNRYPKILYSFDKNINNAQLVTDILRRVTVSEGLKVETVFFDEYDIKDGETPEIVSDKFYNTVFYHWLILLTNDIIDPRFDWCMSSQDLYEFTVKKYGLANIYNTHHYYVTVHADTEFEELVQVTPDVLGASTISNLEHEIRENEKKRRIKILQPKYVAQTESELVRLINA